MHQYARFLPDRLATVMRMFKSNKRGSAPRLLIVPRRDKYLRLVCHRLVMKDYVIVERARQFRGGGTVYRMTSLGLSALNIHMLRSYAITEERVLGEPTIFKPGSQEKIAVLRKRATLGHSLFHPADNQELSRVNNDSITARLFARIVVGKNQTRVSRDRTR
jgi:hypothetical protein